MPIPNNVRDALRDLLSFTVAQLQASGDTGRANRLNALQALTDQRLDGHQAEIDSLRLEVLALIDLDPLAHDSWRQGQEDVWAALDALDPPIDFDVLITSESRAARLTRSLPLLASLERTLFLHSGG